MSDTHLLSVIDSITLMDFTSNPSVKIKFHQDKPGKKYYRLKCTKDTYYSPSDFPTTYIYLESYDTIPDWDYIVSFIVQSVKDSSFNDTSFEALFTRYSDRSMLRVKVELQSSVSANFSSVDTSPEFGRLDINLKGNNFGPSWSCPTWFDNTYASNAGVRTLTGSSQKGLQGISNFIFSFAQATARYGTSIEKYSISITGGFSDTMTAAQIASGTREYFNLAVYYKLVGNVTVTFTVEDTRGMRTSFTRTITIVPYKKLYLTNNDTHRQGGAGSTVVLDFTGSWYGSPLTLTCTGIKAYEEGGSTVYASLDPTVTVSGRQFSFSGVWNEVTFDSDKAYKVTATFTDTVKTVTLTLPIPVGTPVMSIRDKRVGIQNPSPTYTLDVGGIIAQNGHPIMGFVKEIYDSSNSIDLNNYRSTGYYAYWRLSDDVNNFPNTSNANRALILEVIGFGSYIVQKLYYISDGETYIRTRMNGWTSWKKVMMT